MASRYLVFFGVAILLAQVCNSGTAQAQLKKLVMPGDVVLSHAETEGECAACHEAFEKDSQNALCSSCHEDVADDITRGGGFHGLNPDVPNEQCKSCHSEHMGRDADISDLEIQSFDHLFTDFHLLGKHTDVECDSCHVNDVKYRDAPTTCVGCHRDDDIHAGNLGEACDSCHTTEDWLSVEFDHNATDYPLLGKHLDVPCQDCHEDKTFSQTPADCFGCHATDDAHDGRSGKECNNCHNPSDWADTSFDHQRDTSFALAGGHAMLTCNDCHGKDPFADQLGTDCIGCHVEDDSHEGHFGEGCNTCHVTESWSETVFDHDRDTEYALNGAHRDVLCNDCHVEPVFEVSLDSSCVTCHLENDVHKGEQGAQCVDCHNELSWSDNVRFDHGLTRFPLLGAHNNAECDDCHESKEFSKANTACIACHLDENPHGEQYVDDCGQCHNPVSWDLWIFDHNTRSNFTLDGAHALVACNDCHRQTLAAMAGTGDSCNDCHKSDDVHDGEFGQDCGRCHGTESFGDVQSVQ